MIKLIFTNKSTSKEDKTIKINCDKDYVKHILQWYGTFYAGDNYKVKLNDKILKLDINGELVE